ncbi:hypothetical protein B0H17DRAFT_938470 [Mycena rosella]|uniref:CcmS related domain-containing protein n=1 Tax=Mycena rosella TaxID=1033263 RepID=A0AAD7DCL0_MYCRO|nr:hypothetical protein B0H17DRAFT_938470 [Mycena rosella]
MPSKTLAHAYEGTTTSLFTGVPRNKVSESANVQFIDSKGAALKPVHQALFGSKTRMAKDRIHWMFSPNKDERVSSLLAWIEIMSYSLGAYGLHRFLQSRERGALIANADYRSPHNPQEPAFDWLTFDQLQASRDKILQESVAFYDPAVTCIVFVFLPSKSGNSVAMWRRKITIGNNTRASRINEINLAMAGLRREKDYIVHVDECAQLFFKWVLYLNTFLESRVLNHGTAARYLLRLRPRNRPRTSTIMLELITLTRQSRKSQRNGDGGISSVLTGDWTLASFAIMVRVSYCTLYLYVQKQNGCIFVWGSRRR